MRRRNQEMLSYLLLLVTSFMTIMLGVVLACDFDVVPSKTTTNEFYGYSEILLYQFQAENDKAKEKTWGDLENTLRQVGYSCGFCNIGLPVEGVVVNGIVYIFSNEIAKITLIDGEFGKASQLCVGNALQPIIGENRSINIWNELLYVNAIAGTNNGRLNEYVYLNYDCIDDELRRKVFNQYAIPTVDSEECLLIFVGGNDGTLYSKSKEIWNKLSGINGLSVTEIPTEYMKEEGKSEEIVAFREKLILVVLGMSFLALIRAVLVFIEQRKKDYFVMRLLGTHKKHVILNLAITIALAELQVLFPSILVAILWKVILRSQSLFYTFNAVIISWMATLLVTVILGSLLLYRVMRGDIATAMRIEE